jgi:dolichol kinase
MKWTNILVMEIKRKMIHLTGILVPLGILIIGVSLTTYVLMLSLAIALVLEEGRLHGKIRLPAVVRDHEQYRIAGYFYFILGSLLAVIVFPPMIALTALLMLTIGDAASGIYGATLRGSNVRSSQTEGRRPLAKPLPVGVGMLLTCLTIGYVSSSITYLALPVYLAGAIGATIADAIPIPIGNRVIDDNLTIPIFSGGLMVLITLL